MANWGNKDHPKFRQHRISALFPDPAPERCAGAAPLPLTGSLHEYGSLLFTALVSVLQAKTIRQTTLRAAAEQVEVLSESEKAQKQIDTWKKTAARYQDEPETGEGRDQLAARASRRCSGPPGRWGSWAWRSA